MISRHYVMEGLVQGVGFRPFVHRLATHLKLNGWVQNNNGCVSILVEGEEKSVADFERKMITDAPPLAKPSIRERLDKTVSNVRQFLILGSDSQRGNSQTYFQLPADLYCCPDCQWELTHDNNRRYQYAFINCTQCGPRYTIIDALPYDRGATSMADFPLCPDCQKEYKNAEDRRFHAEPLACPVCGPQLVYTSLHEGIQADALEAACAAVASGQLVAVKGIGGFHLVCDAGNREAVAWLREKKPRPDKPLAVMVLPEKLADFAYASEAHIEQLVSPVRPVVLCPRREDAPIADNIAPGLSEIGILFPYSPLHLLLLEKLRRPLVVTSANISGEPVFTDNNEIRKRMGHVIDGILDHNRPIRRPADDSVVQIIAGQPHRIRIGRGQAPLELRNPYRLAGKTLLATGAQSKNTLCLAFEDRLLISPHIADMESLRSLKIFQQLTEDFSHLYQRQPDLLAHDAHPDYATTRWAVKQDLPHHPVWHHHAHASSLFARTGHNDLNPHAAITAFTWDGVGLGSDGLLWGGECLSGTPGNWQRALSFKPFKLPGGDKAAREPWRIADSLRLHCGIEFSSRDPLLISMWQQNLNSPQTSAVGRLLDGCAALLGICEYATYEGQAPMELMALAEQSDTDKFIEMPIVNHQVLWLGLVKWLVKKEHDPAYAARVVHNSLAHSLAKQALQASESNGSKVVGISGGVFQNRLLVEQIATLLTEQGLILHHPAEIPVNDGGLCIGQAIEVIAVLQKHQHAGNGVAH